MVVATTERKGGELMAKMCKSCVFFDDVDLWCLAIEDDVDNITDEECDCYEPIMDGGDEE